ncbi:hypothetical protein Drose_02625 [Dactylosporangium roseum]|uniref:Mce-associated membrane protein n=1 Tax=Dactylosporangium roseum TaxID=47989 RepID=A0ABY5Z6D3_9ACTN|nr:hypothetical protein [Dactylosporangium roseum]UWZ37219.1 hypothetical protein Drose_02625 [Dactylosporangium roseum]
MDPSKPNEPEIDRSRPIPKSRPGGEEVLEGEIIGRDVPLGRLRPPPSTPPGPANKPMGVRRTLLLVLVSVAALVCLAGSLTAYFWYDKATTPDRSSPTVTLQQYVNARFNLRDAARARVFECNSPRLEAVDQAIDEILGLEARYNIAISTSVSDLSVSNQGDRVDVSAHLNVVVPEANGLDSVQVQKWTFHFVKSDSWRVCGAERIL